MVEEYVYPLLHGLEGKAMRDMQGTFDDLTDLSVRSFDDHFRNGTLPDGPSIDKHMYVGYKITPGEPLVKVCKGFALLPDGQMHVYEFPIHQDRDMNTWYPVMGENKKPTKPSNKEIPVIVEETLGFAKNHGNELLFEYEHASKEFFRAVNEDSDLLLAKVFGEGHLVLARSVKFNEERANRFKKIALMMRPEELVHSYSPWAEKE